MLGVMRMKTVTYSFDAAGIRKAGFKKIRAALAYMRRPCVSEATIILAADVTNLDRTVLRQAINEIMDERDGTLELNIALEPRQPQL